MPESDARCVAIRSETDGGDKDVSSFEWDVFVSHASEDKVGFVEPLVKELQKYGLRVWFDAFSLKIGDSLRESIDRGLAKSKYGIVVLSRSFFAKNWPAKELATFPLKIRYRSSMFS
jgi:hypothetical protein